MLYSTLHYNYIILHSTAHSVLVLELLDANLGICIVCMYVCKDSAAPAHALNSI